MSVVGRATKFIFGSRNPYESIKDSGTRQAVSRQTASEDWMIPDLDADRMDTRIRNLTRNAVLPAWAVRRHVDYLTAFEFKATIPGQDELNDDIEQWMKSWSSRFKCDAARKHSFPSLIRLLEQCRTVDGDVFALKVGGTGPRRGSIQLIEAQRVRDPKDERRANGRDVSKQRWIRGIRLTQNGIARQYAIHKRTEGSGSGFELDQIVPATAVVHCGYFQRVDQLRGVSPLHAAANTFKDLHESQVYAAAGIKAAQMVGLVIKQAYQGNNLGAVNVNPNSADETAARLQKMKWGPKPQFMALGHGDDAEFIDSKKPSVETKAFMEAMQYMGMKALDIPRSAWDESIANYSSMRSARIEYEQAQRSKVRELREDLDEITMWRLGMAFADSELVFPRGVTWGDVTWKWTHTGQPFVDPDKEAKAIEKQISLGLTNPYDAAAMIGKDYEENILKTNRAQQFARDQGDFVPTYSGQGSVTNDDSNSAATGQDG